MYRQRKYKLVNLDNGTELTLDDVGSNNTPIGASDNEATIKKSTKNFSITTEYSDDITLTNNGASFLRDAFSVKREEATVQMYEYRVNPNTDVEELFYVGTFDFYEFVQEGNKVSIPFKSGGLTSLVDSKYSTKYELNRETSIDDEEIEALTVDKFASTTLPLELNTLLETSEDDGFNDSFRMDHDELQDFRYGFLSLPVSVTYESDDNIKGVPNNLFDEVYLGSGTSYYSPFNQSSQTFISSSDLDRDLTITINTSFRVDYLTNDRTQNRYGALVLLKYTGGDTPECILDGDFFYEGSNNVTELKDLTHIFDNYAGFEEVEYSEVLKLKVLKGESYAFGVLGGGFFLQDSKLKINLEDTENSIEINELSVVTEYSRVSDFVFNKHIGEQFTRILTGQSNRYYSEYLTTGEGKYTGLCSGKMIRGFEDETLTTSLKEFLTNTQCLMAMGWNVENINGVDVLVHEPLKHFFRQEHVISLPQQVNNLKRTPAKEMIYSEITSGYKKPDGDNLYEEVNGLLEVNTENVYTTPIKKNDNEFNLVSPYRADSNGKELTYRQHQTVNPDGDYRTDNTIFNIDAKESGTNIYEEKTYESYYDQLPYSPDGSIGSAENLTGLNFTPFRNLERWNWFLNSGLTAQTSGKILYASTIGNSTMITKKAGEEEKAEDGKYSVIDLEAPRFVAEWVEFEHEVSYEIATLLKGTTNVNGRDIPNVYFKIQYINDEGEKEYGYLFELNPSKTGKWKILKAF